MPPDALLKALRIRAITTFKMYQLALKLEFDLDSENWVLHFARDPNGGAGGLKRRATPALRTPARAARARRGRKATLKRILFISYKITARVCARTWSGKISPFLASTLRVVRARWADCEARFNTWRVAARSPITPQDAVIALFNTLAPAARDAGARLEQEWFGGEFGLAMRLSTFRPVIEWDAWLFGRPAQERERALA